LREIEAMLGGQALWEHFRLIFGTSTGSIIAALLGEKVDDIHLLYRTHVPRVTEPRSAEAKSAALAALAKEVFKEKKFDEVKTGIGIVATRWVMETPMIFKASIDQAHARTATFVPGFGCTIGDAVQASCSAYPFFNRKVVRTAAGNDVELIDGGYCANNPTLYAIADALLALKVPPEDLRVVSVGVGV
jgi:patatin-like phospholipase/acyl hydrolase